MFALAVTFSEKIKFNIFDLEKVAQYHGEENCTYAIRSQMFECVLLIVFIILGVRQHRKRMIIIYFKHLNRKRRSRSQKRKTGYSCLITNA